MKNIIGPPVTGDEFFGRARELAYVWNELKAGNNIILPSPRRVGKTSFALKLVEYAKDEKWHTVSLNMERVRTEQGFVEAFIDELKRLDWWVRTKEKGKEIVESLKKMKPKVGYGDATVALEWQSNKDNIYKQLGELLNHGEPMLVFLDELTVLLKSIVKNDENGVSNATGFLHWLRDLRITAGSKIRWIYCSSVGIENFTHRYNISHTVNDISPYQLQLYTNEESVRMLRALGLPNDFIAATVVSKLGYCLPFFLQIIYSKMHYLVIIEGRLMDNTLVELAYNELIRESHFNTWEERLTDQYDDKVSAKLLLNHICRNKKGVKRAILVTILVEAGTSSEYADDKVSSLLYMLKNDGYLIEEDTRYAFRSPLLRDFWFNRFVK